MGRVGLWRIWLLKRQIGLFREQPILSGFIFVLLNFFPEHFLKIYHRAIQVMVQLAGLLLRADGPVASLKPLDSLFDLCVAVEEALNQEGKILFHPPLGLVARQFLDIQLHLYRVAEVDIRYYWLVKLEFRHDFAAEVCEILTHALLRCLKFRHTVFGRLLLLEHGCFPAFHSSLNVCSLLISHGLLLHRALEKLLNLITQATDVVAGQIALDLQTRNVGVVADRCAIVAGSHLAILATLSCNRAGDRAINAAILLGVAALSDLKCAILALHLALRATDVRRNHNDLPYL